MLELVKGHEVPRVELLSEAFTKTNDVSITANVNASKIQTLFEDFINSHDEPMFFILELPVPVDREERVGPGILKGSHNDVYYIDGCSNEDCHTILDVIGKWIINDGLSTFGFGCHHSNDEILLGKYNIITVYSESIHSYNALFERHHIPQVDTLITAWDTFDADHPGVSTRYEEDGKTVYDIPEAFKEFGMYLAETRKVD